MDGIASAERKLVARARETLAHPRRASTLPRTAPDGMAAADIPVIVAGNASLVITSLRALTPSLFLEDAESHVAAVEAFAETAATAGEDPLVI